ncbi:MAG: hypothetical protein NW206_01090 [Hyphomonadaceae bacterium]|nr:hypothetical protein [Hyphomonadaceae bacterium]
MDGGTGRSLLKPAAGAKIALSTAQLDKRFDLRRRAKADGGQNLPRHDASELSAVEQDVLRAVAAERGRIDQARLEAKAEAERRLRALAPTPQDFAGPALDARLALKQAAGRVAHDWADAARQATQAREDLEAFKRANGLRRAAHYPHSPLMQVGLLFCAALFEALFSAALFAEDDSRGLLGGAITAVGLSGANVTLGFLAGFIGLRHLQHVRWWIKALGGAAFAALAALALMLNLFAADWRDRMAAVANPAEPSSDASFQLWSLLHLQTPQAIILLMLGAGVWVFATLKGYSGLEDPYPDFGNMDRAAAEATGALSEFRAEARAALEAPVNEARAALSARLEKMRSEFDAMTRAFDEAAAQVETLDAQARGLDEAAASAIFLYRQENAAARPTPAPAYFSVAPPAIGASLDALGAAAAMIDDARTRLSEAQAQSAAALEELVGELDKVTRELNEALPV